MLRVRVQRNLRSEGRERGNGKAEGAEIDEKKPLMEGGDLFVQFESLINLFGCGYFLATSFRHFTD